MTACVTRLRTLKTDLLAISCLLPLAEFLRVFFFCSGLASGENNFLPLSLQKEYFILYRKCLDAIKICMAEFLENVKVSYVFRCHLTCLLFHSGFHHQNNLIKFTDLFTHSIITASLRMLWVFCTRLFLFLFCEWRICFEYNFGFDDFRVKA